ncbi:MAG: Fis family transcriptional regulator [Amphritea sp.]|nr:Fis family transcriptional regulator [Amphritea sp.]
MHYNALSQPLICEYTVRKSDKKLENQLRITLTEVCEASLKEDTGFQWLTHTVDYQKFPDSLQITCMFDTPENLAEFLKSAHKAALTELIRDKLDSVGIRLKKPERQVVFDIEGDENKGEWH